MPLTPSQIETASRKPSKVRRVSDSSASPKAPKQRESCHDDNQQPCLDRKRSPEHKYVLEPVVRKIQKHSEPGTGCTDDYYNFCLSHRALRQKPTEPQATKGKGSPKKYLQRTPTMAERLTDRRRTLMELMSLRMPPARGP